MKKFKLADIIISIVLMIGLGLPVAFEKKDAFGPVIRAYCIVGAWQCISMIVHECMQWFTRYPGVRRVYHVISLVLLVTMPVGSIFILIFTAAPMALFYTGLCIYELKVKTKRPLSILK